MLIFNLGWSSVEKKYFYDSADFIDLKICRYEKLWSDSKTEIGYVYFGY